MGWRLLRRVERGGRVAEKMNKDVDEIYELDGASDVDAFLASRKRKGGTIVERQGNVAFYFTIEELDVERRPPTANGRVQVVVKTRLSLLKQSGSLVEPWNLAPYNFRITTTSIAESTRRFYPGTGDIVYPRGSFEARPFVNTAGEFLSCRTSYGLARIAFSYNAPVDAFDPRLFWAAEGKINLSTIVVCGMTFPPRVLKIESLNAEYDTESVETYDANGAQTTTTWKFFRIDAVLLANPRSYDQLFLNVGKRTLRDGVLRRLWRWTNPRTLKSCYGTRREYLASGAADGEAVSEPVPLDALGTGVSPVSTYRVGSPFEPVEFSALNLPSQGPEQWRIVNADD